jgi:hypothetical protein
MKELISKELLGFEIQIIEAKYFKEFYENCATFNDFSKKSFLKSAGIPANYYLEQPDNTQVDLINNKEELLSTQSKTKFISILKKDKQVLNCSKVKYSNSDFIYNNLLPISNDLIFIRDFIKEGYTNTFLPIDTIEKGKFNLGLFIDFPILLNKNPIVHKGLYYISENNGNEEDFDKCIYFEEVIIDFDLGDLNLLIDDSIAMIQKDSYLDTITKLKDKLLLKELEDILLLLVKEKVIPKSFVKKVFKYTKKKEIFVNSMFDLLKVLLSYDNNISSYKSVKNLRSLISKLDFDLVRSI